MSVGLRNERVRVFTYAGGASAGRINPTYAYVAERWARASPIRASSETVGTQAQHVAVAIFGFSDEVTITRNGLLKWNGRYWKIDSLEPAEALREVQVQAFWVDESGITTTGEPA